MANFPTNRSLLNPKFEGYKFSPLPQDEHVFRFPLIALPTQVNVSGRSRTPLSFEEMQSRITHNHLAISQDAQSAVYVDKDLNVIRVVLNPDLTPTFSTLSELPKPIQSDDITEDSHREYASVVSLESWWLVSDGMGLLYVLSECEEGDRIAALYHLPGGDSSPSSYTPFRIHDARLKSSDTAVCLLSCRHKETSEQPENKKGAAKAGAAHFDVLLVEVSITTRSEGPQALKVVWKARGDDIPTHVEYDDSRKAFLILGKSAYRAIGSVIPPTYEPTSDEMAPIPRAEEVLPDVPSKPPPYSWTQTSDSVTVAFPLPSNVPKSAIHVTLTQKTLSLLVKHELPTSLPLPRYSLKQLWDGISPSSSFWTWDREADREFGLLTLHLDKQHEGPRWAQVFASAGRAPASERTDPTDEEVAETLDPSELYAIREALEKYTSALQRGEDVSGLGLGSGVPSLAEGELDESVDTSVGRQVAITWVQVDGTVPYWWRSKEFEDAAATSLLSVPLPGLRISRPSLVVRNDIDGLLFTLPPLSISDESSTSAPAASSSQYVWQHETTFNALSFVLASKRDTRFTFHFSTTAVLAFESGVNTGGGNVYIYYGLKPGSKAAQAKQAVLKVGGGATGALLGVGTLEKVDHSRVILCLCEKELVLLKNVI